MESRIDHFSDFYSELLEDSQYAIVAALDRETRVLSGNRAVCDLMGPNPVGKSLNRFLSPGSVGTLSKIMEQISPGETSKASIIHIAPMGSTAAPDSYIFKLKALDSERILLFGEPVQRLSNKEAEQYMIITNELSSATRELEKAKKILQLRAEELERANERLNREIEQRIRTQREKEMVIADLEKALAEVKRLSGMLPICASCKKIRDDEGYWRQIEAYISSHSEAQFSHGICPECAMELYPELYEE